MRTDRCRDWVKLRELDDVATGMALRVIDDAINHGGLLKDAIIQVQRNFEMRDRGLARLGWGNRRQLFVQVGLDVAFKFSIPASLRGYSAGPKHQNLKTLFHFCLESQLAKAPPYFASLFS